VPVAARVLASAECEEDALAAVAVIATDVAATAKAYEKIFGARARKIADSIATYAPTPTEGWVRVIGDLPDDAVISLDRKRMSGWAFPAPPGIHSLAIASSEFQPYGTRIRVQIGDTAKVYVELLLKPSGDSIPQE
jgi:hypothetical protein